jgi:MscS family membrane protein
MRIVLFTLWGLMMAIPGLNAAASDSLDTTQTTTNVSETAPPATPALAVSTVEGNVSNVANKASSKLGEWLGHHLGAWSQQTFLGTELWRYASAFVLLLLVMIIARLVRYSFEKWLPRLARHTRMKADDMVLETAGSPASLFVTSLGLWMAILPLLAPFSSGVQEAAMRLAMAVAASAVLWYLYLLAGVMDHYLRKLAQRTDNDLDDAFVDVMRKTARVFILVVGILFIGQSILHLRITALLASAGIAGLAIAFAAQDTIANIFGSIMILLDRPFKIGERVKVADADGTIAQVGFRSTRIRTLDGHLVSLPNKMVADAKVENVARRPHIKRVANITITYDTPVAKVEKAVQIIRDILANHPGMAEDFQPRVYFNDFNDWSLNIIMIAWYHPAEYWQYLEWCQDVNLKIMRQFEAEGIEFAFPTNTTYLAHDPNRELTIKTQEIAAQFDATGTQI